MLNASIHQPAQQDCGEAKPCTSIDLILTVQMPANTSAAVNQHVAAEIRASVAEVRSCGPGDCVDDQGSALCAWVCACVRVCMRECVRVCVCAPACAFALVRVCGCVRTMHADTSWQLLTIVCLCCQGCCAWTERSVCTHGCLAAQSAYVPKNGTVAC